MSAPKNIQRDGLWTKPDSSEDLSFGASVLVSAAPQVNSDGAVHVDYAQAHSIRTATFTTSGVDHCRCMGVLMQPPDGDNTPYRVKASAHIQSLADYSEWHAIVVGYAPASPTGSNDQVAQSYWIPFKKHFDDLIMVPALDSGDPNFGRALVIAVAMCPGPAITNYTAQAQLSVQNLGIKPPTMQNAVS